MIGKRKPSGRGWPLTKKECMAKKPPHRLQAVTQDHAQYCLLCGTTLVRPSKTAARRAA